MGDEKRAFLSEKPEEQRHLLGKSIREFESGHLSEAVRLAIAIRLLVHETASCKPLLAQPTPNYVPRVQNRAIRCNNRRGGIMVEGGRNHDSRCSGALPALQTAD